MATHVQPREEYYRDFNTWASEQQGWCPTPRKRACASRLNPGHVASATLEEFEAQGKGGGGKRCTMEETTPFRRMEDGRSDV